LTKETTKVPREMRQSSEKFGNRTCLAYEGPDSASALLLEGMQGTFKGLPLKIIALKTTVPTAGTTRTTFRVLSGPMPELEERLRLNEPALLILSSQEIEGTIDHFSADPGAYEITIETKE